MHGASFLEWASRRLSVEISLFDHLSIFKPWSTVASPWVPDEPRGTPQDPRAQIVWAHAGAIAPGPDYRQVADFHLGAVFGLWDAFALVNVPNLRADTSLSGHAAFPGVLHAKAFIPIEHRWIVTRLLLACLFLKLASSIDTSRSCH